MKRVSNNQHSRHGFTIIELLTVMSIIIILIGLLVPSLNRVRRYSMDVKQKAQFHSIAIALDLFNSEFDGYPNSDAVDDQATPQNYCGAMKLTEAMVGQDLKGFNPASRFERSGFGNATPTPTIYPPLNSPDAATYNENIRSRKMYLQLENANAYLISDIYSTTVINQAGYGSTKGFDPNTYVLCDSYNRVTNKTTGKKMGMPILYYKADSTKLKHPLPGDSSATISANIAQYIYNVLDNQDLIDMGLPWWSPGPVHPLASGGGTPEGASVDFPKKFYDITRDTKISTGDRPVRADSYILMSAGFDGEYGTKDDIYNFGD
ncbi:MAG: prepilin-type N-terminal cleavage/methylation domain-containing protein [Sedimentisphaerales bacterium]